MADVLDGSQIEQQIKQVAGTGMIATRADIRPDLFDTAIRQKGYRILWEQGMFCSCNSSSSGQPDYTCPACFGKGYIYFDPKEIRALVTSINGHKEQGHIGLDDMGSAYLTPESTDYIGFRDRFTFMDFTTKFSEVVTRDKDQNGSLSDTLRYSVIDVLAVRVLDRIYLRGQDFDITGDDTRSLTWKENFLYSGDQYSILYTTHPVYVAIGPIHELRGTYSLAGGKGLEVFHQLPKQYQIKREDFLNG
jgi:hypothetical protein